MEQFPHWLYFSLQQWLCRACSVRALSRSRWVWHMNVVSKHLIRLATRMQCCIFILIVYFAISFGPDVNRRHSPSSTIFNKSWTRSFAFSVRNSRAWATKPFQKTVETGRVSDEENDFWCVRRCGAAKKKWKFENEVCACNESYN